MKNVLVRLEEYLPRASEAERGAIKWLMQSPESAVDLSIQQLAGRTFTSASTIIRLCRKLGFDGYKEFHKALLYELAVRREASDEQTREIDRADTLEAIAQKVTYRNILSLENTDVYKRQAGHTGRRNAAISSGWRTRCAGGISSLT